MYCAQISDLISSVIIYMCSFVLFMKQFMNKRLDANESKSREKGGNAA
jgi:simple sugar transport system permease protein